MEIEAHITNLRNDGERLAAAAGIAGLDAIVPSCPDWQVRDLLQHIGGVNRWAASFVTSGNPRPATQEEVAACFAAPPDDQLAEWFQAGHAALVQALAAADPALTCWTFLPAASPLAFWARRQAHETAIHRVDAELAAGTAGTAVTPFATAFAVDGIDELLTGIFAGSRGGLVADPPVTLGVRTTDADAAWTVRIEPKSRAITLGVEAADCIVAGPAHDLYLLLWNRATPDGAAGLELQGDPRVLGLWREKAKVI